MIVAGAKHACATCIRGHRSSSCTHVDRPLFEIRKKGRPVSQCPHCRDLRKAKSCHTRCECGETPAEQSKSSKCKCHSGQACVCAGPVHVVQYLPPALSSASSASATNSSSDGTKTPSNGTATVLHTFPGGMKRPGLENETLMTASQIKMQSSMPYPTAQMHRETSNTRLLLPSDSISDSLGPFAPMDLAQNSVPFAYTAQPFARPYAPTQMTWATEHAQNANRIVPIQRQSSASISRSTRSIGINTDPLPPNIWPKDLFSVPEYMRNTTYRDQFQMRQNNIDHNQQVQTCPKVKDMSLDNLNFDRYSLTESTAPVPSFSTFYNPQHHQIPNTNASDPTASGPTDMLAIDHFSNHDQFDTDYWDQLFDVPGCSLPGVQCRCGENCSCSGCQTHKNNTDNVTFADFERLEFGEQVRKPREHPSTCCDTRSLHDPAVPQVSQTNNEAGTGNVVNSGSCCGSKKK